MSASIRTPSIRINFTPKFAKSESMARCLAAGIEHTFLSEIVSTSSVTSGVGEDATLLDLHGSLYDEDGGGAGVVSGHAIRFVLDRGTMYRKQLSVTDAGRAVANYMGSNGVVVWSEVNMLEWVIRVNVRGLTGMDVETSHIRSMYLIHDFLLDNVPIQGVRGVSRVVVRSDRVHRVDPTSGGLVTDTLWCADTEGTNLLHVLTVKGVDASCTYSNDIHETLQVLGIEAAVHQLLTEIRSVLSHDGAYVNDRHLQLLVDVMTHAGNLYAVTRHSMTRLGASVYTCASFEQPHDVITWGAALGTSNQTNGVTENIMIGNPISGGTGCCDIITRPDALPPPYKPRAPVKPLPLNNRTATGVPAMSNNRRESAGGGVKALHGGGGKAARKRKAGVELSGKSRPTKLVRELVLRSPCFETVARQFNPQSPNIVHI